MSVHSVVRNICNSLVVFDSSIAFFLERVDGTFLTYFFEKIFINLAGGVGASMDVYIWSNSSGLMRIKLSLMSCWSDDDETGVGRGGGGRRGEQQGRRRVLRCVDLLPMTWVGPVDADSRPPPGVVIITCVVFFVFLFLFFETCLQS